MSVAAFRAEMAKQTRRSRTYLALAITIAIPLIIAIALKANPPAQSEGRDSLFLLASRSGLVLPVATLRVMSRFLLIVVVAIFAGDAVAGEAATGNLRYLLIRPIGRPRLLGAKLAAAALFTALATALISLTGLVAGGLFFGWHPIDLAVLGLHQSVGELLAHVLLATLYVMWSMGAIVALGFMVSTMTDAPVGAIGAAVGFGVTSQILDAISALGWIRNALPTHYLDAWDSLFTHGTASADMARGALLQVPYLIVFCAIGWWWFGRKDILS